MVRHRSTKPVSDSNVSEDDAGKALIPHIEPKAVKKTPEQILNCLLTT